MESVLPGAGLQDIDTGLVLTGVALLSLAVGSFLNVVILRLPVIMDRAWRNDSRELLDTPPLAAFDPDLSLHYPPSTCPACGHRIRPWENIPLLSYAALRGRCAGCGSRIPLRYPVVEALTAVLSIAVVWVMGVTWAAAAALLLTWALVALAVIDLDHQLLPDAITLPLLWAGLLLNSQSLFVPLGSAVWGAALGYLSLWSVYWGFRLLTGKEGMGFGDFKLLAALGAWLGWQAVPMVIVLSSAAGAATGIALVLLRRHERSAPMPYGPFLAVAGWVVLLWGGALSSAWRLLPG